MSYAKYELIVSNQKIKCKILISHFKGMNIDFMVVQDMYFIEKFR